jgi:hypothetical protein
VVVATSHRDQRAGERAQGIRPARLRIDPPAPPFQRTLFNGLAQVIVQAGREPAEITLGASSPGLADATLRVRVVSSRGEQTARGSSP